MAPEIEYNWADVDKEYDFEAEMKNREEYYQRRSLEELRRNELEHQLIQIERKLRMEQRRSDRSIRVAERIIEMLRGMALSEEAYNMIRREIDHCYYDHKEMRREREIDQWKRMFQEVSMKIERWYEEEEIERKDFIEESDMKL